MPQATACVPQRTPTSTKLKTHRHRFGFLPLELLSTPPRRPLCVRMLTVTRPTFKRKTQTPSIPIEKWNTWVTTCVSKLSATTLFHTTATPIWMQSELRSSWDCWWECQVSGVENIARLFYPATDPYEKRLKLSATKSQNTISTQLQHVPKVVAGAATQKPRI